MFIKGCNEEDFTNYKKPSMFIIFPYCDFKCDKENGTQLCQNWSLSKQQAVDIPVDVLVNHYICNPITHAIVCGGLEPMRSFPELLELVARLRGVTEDDIVIYTGYNKEELEVELVELRKFSNIIIKFGRFRPNQEMHYDAVLGVSLASDNQYAERIN